ncbi:MAG: hypothetical protein PHN84_15670 [Desulfuromonadaceae bacterium]|nr:hypothetical protein [Desulfuromonadaceae bacterium]MDD2856189.1 hypothetical protein [Desulfuromonadaceae bacterium]
MQKIPLMQAKAGMVLGRDLFRENSTNGMPVCGKGTELTGALIERFVNMGVQTIYVEGHPVWADGERSINDMLSDLDYRFSKTVQNPLNVILHGIYKASLIKSVGGDIDRQAE